MTHYLFNGKDYETLCGKSVKELKDHFLFPVYDRYLYQEMINDCKECIDLFNSFCALTKTVGIRFCVLIPCMCIWFNGLGGFFPLEKSKPAAECEGTIDGTISL